MHFRLYIKGTVNYTIIQKIVKFYFLLAKACHVKAA